MAQEVIYSDTVNAPLMAIGGIATPAFMFVYTLQRVRHISRPEWSVWAKLTSRSVPHDAEFE